MGAEEVETPEASGVVNAFLRILATDRGAGNERPLEAYQQLFPGFESAVARAYAELIDGQAQVSLAEHDHAGNGRTPESGQSVIGHYRLLREIGRGGQAVVYLAEDLRLPRQVALKVLRRFGALSSKEALQRFLGEARTASRLDDPLICPIHEVGEESGVAFIAMRFIPGTTLARLIAEARSQAARGRVLELPAGTPSEGTGPAEGRDSGSSSFSQKARVGRILHMFERVARSIHAAHEVGVVHRDIKPENLMVTPDGNPVILDFGLARDEAASVPQLTMTGDVMGTPVYMSPEQHRGMRCDRRTDVWSLGVALYEALTLERPFQGATHHDITRAILQETIANPRKIAPWIGAELTAVLTTAIEKNVDRRYRTTLDLAEDLRRLRQFEPVHARSPGALLSTWRWCQRHPVKAATAAIAGVALVVLSALFWRINGQADRLTAWKSATHARQRMDDRPVEALRAALDAAREEPQPEINEILLEILDRCHQAYVGDYGPLPGIRTPPTMSADGRSLLVGASPDAVGMIDIATGRVTAILPVGVKDIVAVVPTPAGEIVVFGWDGTIAFYTPEPAENPRALRERSSIPGDGRKALQAVLSPDGRRIVMWGQQGLLALVDLETRTKTVLPGHHMMLRRAIFSRDGRRVLSIGCTDRDDCEGGKEAWIWDVDERRLALRLDLEADEAEWADFDPSGERVAVMSFAGGTRVFDTRTGAAILRVPGTAPGTWIAYSPAGDRILTGSPDGLIIMDARTGTRVRTHALQERSPYRGAFSPDGTKLAVFVRDKTLRVFDTKSWDEIKRCARHVAYSDVVFWTPDGERIVTMDGPPRVWFGGFREFLPQFRGPRTAIDSVAISPDGSRVFSAGRDGVAKIWDRTTGRMIAALEHTKPVRRIRVTRDGTRLLTAAADPSVRVWNAADGALRWSSTGGGAPVLDAFFVENDAAVAAVHEDGVTRLWDTATGALRYEFQARPRVVDKAAVDLERGWIAIGGRDHTVVVHDLGHGGRLLFDFAHEPADRTNPPHPYLGVRGLAFDPLRPRLFSSHEDRPFGYWTLDGSARHVNAEVSLPSVGEIGIDPTGRWVLAAHASLGMIHLVDAESVRKADIGDALDAPSTWTSAIRFRPDGRYALIASRDGTLRIWDMRERVLQNVIRRPGTAILDACFSPDGEWVLLGTSDGEVQMWPLDAVGAAEAYLRRYDRPMEAK